MNFWSVWVQIQLIWHFAFRFYLLFYKLLRSPSKNIIKSEPKVLYGCICTQTPQKFISKHLELTFDILGVIIFDFGKILVKFSKIFIFWKIPRNFKFPSNPAILCFLDSKNSNKPNILSRGGFGGSRMTFFD